MLQQGGMLSQVYPVQVGLPAPLPQRPSSYPLPRLCASVRASSVSRSHPAAFLPVQSWTQSPPNAASQQFQEQQWAEQRSTVRSSSPEAPVIQGGVLGPGGSPYGNYLEQLLKGLRISHEHAAGLLLRCPGLLNLDPRRASILIHSLSKLLGCTHRCSCAVLAKQQRLLLTPPSVVQQQLQLLQLGLLIDSKTVRDVVQRQPSLLFEHPGEVRLRLEQMAAELEVPVPRLLRAAVKEPWLFVANPSLVRPKLNTISSVWCLERHALLDLALQHPQLLTMTHDSIKAKLGSIAQALGIPHNKAAALVLVYPAMLKYSHTKLAHQVDALKQLLPLEDSQIQAIIVEEPSLLARSSASPEASFCMLQQLLGCSKAQAANLVARRPSLLTSSPKSLRQMFAALSIWRFSLDTKRQLLHSHPLLFRLSPREVHGRCRWLRKLMMSNPYFHSTLRNLPLPLLGVLLLHLPKAWSRLLYIAESSREGAIDIMHAVQCKSSTFEATFPEYNKWRSYTVGPCSPWRLVNSGLERSPPVPPKRGRRKTGRSMPSPPLPFVAALGTPGPPQAVPVPLGVLSSSGLAPLAPGTTPVPSRLVPGSSMAPSPSAPGSSLGATLLPPGRVPVYPGHSTPTPHSLRPPVPHQAAQGAAPGGSHQPPGPLHSPHRCTTLYPPSTAQHPSLEQTPNVPHDPPSALKSPSSLQFQPPTTSSTQHPQPQPRNTPQHGHSGAPALQPPSIGGSPLQQQHGDVWTPSTSQPPTNGSSIEQQQGMQQSWTDVAPMCTNGSTNGKHHRHGKQQQEGHQQQRGSQGPGEPVEAHEGITVHLGSKLAPGMVLQKPKRVVHPDQVHSDQSRPQHGLHRPSPRHPHQLQEVPHKEQFQQQLQKMPVHFYQRRHEQQGVTTHQQQYPPLQQLEPGLQQHAQQVEQQGAPLHQQQLHVQQQ